MRDGRRRLARIFRSAPARTPNATAYCRYCGMRAGERALICMPGREVLPHSTALGWKGLEAVGEDDAVEYTVSVLTVLPRVEYYDLKTLDAKLVAAEAKRARGSEHFRQGIHFPVSTLGACLAARSLLAGPPCREPARRLRGACAARSSVRGCACACTRARTCMRPHVRSQMYACALHVGGYSRTRTRTRARSSIDAPRCGCTLLVRLLCCRPCRAMSGERCCTLYVRCPNVAWHLRLLQAVRYAASAGLRAQAP